MSKADYSKHLDDADGEMERQTRWWKGLENQALCRQIAERIPEGATVIDAGAGSGAAIPIWLERAQSVIAIDSSIRASAVLRSLGDVPRVYAVKGDLRKVLGLYEADVVIAKHVLKHFGPEWRMLLEKMCDAAEKRVVFTMNVAAHEGDLNPDVPYYDWAASDGDIAAALPTGWNLVERFGAPAEPVFVADKVASDKVTA